jgi:hypothetical protein
MLAKQIVDNSDDNSVFYKRHKRSRLQRGREECALTESIKERRYRRFYKHRENVRNDVHLDSINIDLIYLNY